LTGFRLTVNFLEVYKLRDLRVHKYMVTSSHTRQTEAERFNKRDSFWKVQWPMRKG
jgi:hypothetical protein